MAVRVLIMAVRVPIMALLDRAVVGLFGVFGPRLVRAVAGLCVFVRSVGVCIYAHCCKRHRSAAEELRLGAVRSPKVPVCLFVCLFVLWFVCCFSVTLR